VAVAVPRQGEVWWCALDPVIGSEIAKTRPVLIASVDRMNEQPARRSIVVPLTSTQRPAGVQIALEVKGTMRVSYAEAYQVRAVSHDRLTTRLGVASLEARRAVSRQLALLTRSPATPLTSARDER
jgi:mRNA interferase MazF